MPVARFIMVTLGLTLLLIPANARADHGVETVHGGLLSEFIEGPPDPSVATGHLSVSARDAQSGSSGNVQFFQRIRFLQNEFPGVIARFQGDVDCLQVSANAAVLSGDITSSSGLPEGFDDRFMVTVVDGGNPQGEATTDTAVVSIFGEPNATEPTTCVTTANLSGAFNPPEVRGNITVHDDV
jgi:hypothetical protein